MASRACHRMADEAPLTMREQVLDKLAALITAAFGLVAALAWNEAIKGLIARYLSAGSGLAAQFAYAGFVTLIAVLASVWVARSIQKAKLRAAARRAAKT